MITATVVGVLAGIVGFVIGAAVMVRTPEPPPPLPRHEHCWGEWEHFKTINVYSTESGSRPIRRELTQRRTCTLCQFAEYHTDRI